MDSLTSSPDNDSDWVQVVHYLKKLDIKQIKELGGWLGLSLYSFDKMKDLLDDMVRAWLRREDDVIRKCGSQLTWEILVEKLTKMGQKGIADEIRNKECQQTDTTDTLQTVKPQPTVLTQEKSSTRKRPRPLSAHQTESKDASEEESSNDRLFSNTQGVTLRRSTRKRPRPLSAHQTESKDASEEESSNNQLITQGVTLRRSTRKRPRPLSAHQTESKDASEEESSNNQLITQGVPLSGSTRKRPRPLSAHQTESKDASEEESSNDRLFSNTQGVPLRRSTRKRPRPLSAHQTESKDANEEESSNDQLITQGVPLSGATSQWSDRISTKPSSAPSNTSVLNEKLTDKKVQNLKWTQPKVSNEYVKNYTVYARKSLSDHSRKVAGTKTECTVDELDTNTEDVFRVYPECGKPHCSGCPSDESDLFRTKPTSAPKSVQTKSKYTTHNSIQLSWKPPDKYVRQDLVCKSGKPTPLNITHESIQLRWDKPEFIGSGRIHYYSVSYWQEGGIKHNVTTIGTLEEVTLQSLSTNKEYYCEVTPKLISDEDVPCVPSVSDPIRTKSTSEPGKPKAVRRTHDSIELQWTKPKHGSENVEYYVVRYRLINEVELNRCPGLKLSVSECDKPTQSMIIGTLEANSKYVFQVHPDCKHGSKGTDSCFSDPISTTCTSLPGNIRPLVVTHNSIKLRWTKPIYGSENILHYVVSYCTANEHKEVNPKWIKTEKTTADETQITLTGLSTRTNYFFKVHPECTNGDGAVYESTDSEPTETKATSPPGQPQCVSLTHNSIRLKWAIPKYGSENIESYTVSYYPQEHPEQIRQKPSVSNKMEVHTLRSNVAYIFKVHPECSHGTSTESPVSEPIMTQPCCQPGNVIAKPANVTHSSIRIEWTKPEFGNVESYLVKCYQERDMKNEIAKQTIDNFSKLCAEFKNLQPKTWYMFKVTPQCQSAHMEKIGIESTCSEPIETSNRPLAERMRSKSLCISTGSPVIYKVPVHYVMKDHNNKIAKCYIGDPPKEPVTEKILMVVGATGAGKTTLINGITNYIFNVQWENNFRFKLITKENPERDESHSQTSWITAYTFYPIEGSCIDYTLTIIDTPGFGDCEGVDRDKRITNQIQEFFSIPPPHDVNEIHGIGFVTQSSLARLTPTQKYIFDSILAIFGKDIAENIFLMCTFADGQLPPVLNAVKAAKVPGGEKKHFKFNNSAVFAKVDETTEMNFDQMFWKMGKQSFESFFKDFQAAPCQSLQLTKEVMMDRQHLEILVERFHQQIKMGLSKIDELQQEEQVLKNHQEDIEANKNFIFEVKVIKFKEVQLDEGKYVTNCDQCKMTCHADCTIKEDDEKYKCRAMGWFWQKTDNAHCKVCPGRCHWKKHVNKNYYYVPEEVPEKRSLEHLKTKYEQAVGGKTKAEQMISKNEKDLEDLRSAVLDIVREMKEKDERLQEIALKPNPLTEESYVEILIESEKREAATGFEKRVASLEMIKKRVKLLSRANSAGSREDMKAARGKSWWKIWKELFKSSI